MMTQKLSMRIATQSDASVIANLYLASRKKYISFAPLVHSDTAIQQWMHDILIPSAQVWVVEKNDVIIGMMAIDEIQGVNWIEQLYVLPEAVGHGAGSLLMAKAKSLNSSIRLRTFQENLSARRFYERHGFKILEFSDGSENEEQCPDMLYEWKS
ncbi:MAG: GNAT family N-acetyltransferase [Legionellaceae bacterium]|nr:GNAT family N-acetyltransferase [Legionellaceae bacterium]